MSSKKPPKIAIVAGEHSGDLLGAGLMQAISKRHPGAYFIGVGGPLMAEQGMDSYFPMDDLAVMGIAEVVQQLPKLLRHRKKLVQYLIEEQPDVMIGIDAPDFNLTVETRLKNAGIATIHYVSPSVWAWREGRIKGIKKAVDHVLCLLPFEKDFYDKHGLPATFVGHPLADDIPMQWQQTPARKELKLEPESEYLAILPGSRKGEIARMAPVFLRVAKKIAEKYPNLRFVAPMISDARAEQFQELIKQYSPELTIALPVGESRKVMAASNYLLLTSGTVALEALLIKRPMVVAYRFHWLSYQIIKRLFHAPFFSLPNLLAGKEIVPELAQSEASEEGIEQALVELIEQDNTVLLEQFKTIHQQLKVSASEKAANVVDSFL
ncbi:MULTISPECIES: lipid-A-disaccharide synthase [Idiomarina]|jgi:lipid-A-disaccharide synthase|uniref:lipid-A-disaccharide synthase n=1 Tax=Idiomarina TaxID=135575 RepID=UPI000C0B4DE7|nr:MULTISPECIES: lipid-A-disaccharide synthase [Idiomarina]MAB21298.1 lipid-A-disaccharide synthase [Idiomarina sp.]MAL84012.1 lipid-A-disaccharide synthase [Idiomarina sp.]MBE91713.1 lipid-A-disaccharide synthase [Idiomarina sp.]MBH95508.1 lipid-A-disaccharide synthase [Idiomarina sp.]MBP57983.1 lipid-A-disaccharide synthase [Idiomarina sp.]|tara:strand:- start:910 stop:2049 length:1140 start_codon:yes stop_codon:yes gene_type:complete